MRRAIFGCQLLCACATIAWAGSAARLSAQAASAVQAAPAAAARQLLPDGAERQIVQDVIAVVRKHYVHPDRVSAITTRLQQSLASGRYATTSPLELSERLSADLRASSGNDGHMYINYNPAEASARTSAARSSEDPEQSAAFFREQMRRSNHGITELRILPGNVRYLHLSQWLWDPAATPRVYDDAVRFLREGDAVIIDISRNGGGSAEAVNYLVSHLLGPGRKLMTFRDGPTEIEETFTQKVAGAGLTGKPLFVLTSSRSGSASEEFAAHIRHFRLGTLVGKTTAGAGNPNSLFPVAHGFVVSISTGLAIHPVTNKGWESEGIAPHEDVELSRALDVAHAGALNAQLARASGQERPQLEWLIAALEAEPGGGSASADQLRSFAGRFEGDRRVSERAGRLYWRRADGPEVELVPLGGTRFAVGDRFGTRLDFAAQDGVVLTRPGAPPERLGRLTHLGGR
jgi:hypothetical protein